MRYWNLELVIWNLKIGVCQKEKHKKPNNRYDKILEKY